MVLSINDLSVEALEHCLKYLNARDLLNVQVINKRFYHICNSFIQHEFRKAGIRQAENKDSDEYKAYANLKLVSDAFMQSGLSNIFLSRVIPLKFGTCHRDAFCPSNEAMRKFLPSLMSSLHNCTSDNACCFQIIMTLSILRYLKEFKGAVINEPFGQAQWLDFSFNLPGVKLYRFWTYSIVSLRRRQNFRSESEFQDWLSRTTCINLLVILSELYSASNSGVVFERTWKSQTEWHCFGYNTIGHRPNNTSIYVCLTGNIEVLNFFLKWFKSEAETFVWPENWPNGDFLTEINIMSYNFLGMSKELHLGMGDSLTLE